MDAQAFSQCVADMVPSLRNQMAKVRWIVCILFFFIGSFTYTKVPDSSIYIFGLSVIF